MSNKPVPLTTPDIAATPQETATMNQPQESPQPVITPEQLAALLGQQYPPTSQQAAIIGADTGPLLVVAGAGAGKTETMAARVVWLVANGIVHPDEVLGLTFTKKAAQQLSRRIRQRLARLQIAPGLRTIDPAGKIAKALAASAPEVSTYDAFAGNIVGEFGLLAAIEPARRLITDTEQVMIARQVVQDFTGELTQSVKAATLADTVRQLANGLDSHLISEAKLTEETRALIDLIEQAPRAPRQREALNKTLQEIIDRQQQRLELLPLVQRYRQRLDDLDVTTFSQQLAQAAHLAATYPRIGEQLRRRYRVIMLDEYQDTSHAQRVLLRSLFGTGDNSLTVTAVGDPMQAIYGWRGATASNLANFVYDFPSSNSDGTTCPAPKAELTVSWRNPNTVLDCANLVSNEILGSPTNPARPVQPLTPRPDAPAGDVDIRLLADAEGEEQAIVSWVASRYQQALDEGHADEFSCAILVRTNKAAPPLATALAAHNIPCEIAGLAGLLFVPEVADVVAFATMLVDPGMDSATLRILLGPAVEIALEDLTALLQRARNLQGRSRIPGEDTQAGDSLEELADHWLLHAPWRDRTGADQPHIQQLARQLAAAITQEPAPRAGLADALADLGERDRYTSGGVQRLERMSAMLRQLRAVASRSTIVDTLGEIIRLTGLRVEIYARNHPGAPGSSGAAHVDQLLAEAARYQEIPGATLRGFLEYLRLAEEAEGGLRSGEITPAPGRVQIMTAHKAKGLEFAHVVVAQADGNNYPSEYFLTKAHNTWQKTVTEFPPSLLGEDSPTHHDEALPQLILDPDMNRKEIEQALEEHQLEMKQHLAEEAARLLYVAITRAEQDLLVTAYRQTKRNRPLGFSTLVDTITSTYPELLRYEAPVAGSDTATSCTDDLHHEAESVQRTAAELELFQRWLAAPLLGTPPEPIAGVRDSAAAMGVYPADHLQQRRAGMVQGRAIYDSLAAACPTASEDPVDAEQSATTAARLVSDPGNAVAAPHAAPEDESLVAGDDAAAQLVNLWQQEVTALIAEQQRQQQATVELEFPSDVTASDMVAMASNPDAYARRLARPVPFQPNRFAKRGTALHQWLEERFDGQGMLDFDDLPGTGEFDPQGEELAQLKAAFQHSPWASRQPAFVEEPFAVVIGDTVVRGRIDAVFHTGDDPTAGWQVVDWKTGRVPTGAKREQVAIQLAVYRVAWAKLVSEKYGVDIPADSIDAGFYYIGANEFVAPSTLPSEHTLAQLVAHTASRAVAAIAASDADAAETLD
ncbi:UvrD-helicase domain-containing protein [Corynebacterium choanae]|uniref:DNA 3'-5' helicase n=1 Tax=Corynebacterium choanae TaxID=1862358 RepID=A0A3G6J4R2_9CORY|nr:UvrD-helicase domain-containing protein [Corynebacterium choanae]AZA12939.1 ATP-dependent DNA helicase UvrD1 [Corynebacterium choanae]